MIIKHEQLGSHLLCCCFGSVVYSLVAVVVCDSFECVMNN